MNEQEAKPTQNEPQGGNGNPPPSQVIVHFLAPGIADPLKMERVNASSGQTVVAGFWLLASALWEIFQSLTSQQVQRVQNAQMMQSLINNPRKQ